MTFPWEPISRPFSEARPPNDRAEVQFDVVVVGSGYGGGVAASRLARTGKHVAVLERGREIKPGDYPRDATAAMDEFQVTLTEAGEKLGKRDDGLYDLRVNEEMNVLVGCGLGGTSLINANVALEADPRVFGTWPKPFRETPDLLKPYYERARKMLGSKPYPDGKTPPKMRALMNAAEGMKAPFRRPDINVSFADGHNAAGVWQAACTDCGDCVSGCNYGAKNTVLMNYLPDAQRHGAEIFTGAEVVSLARGAAGWTLLVRDLADGGAGALRALQADVVVLAAGTLGSTEILLRSRGTIALSERLGEHFSGNGDIWAFGYNANIPDGEGGRAPVHGVGAGPNDVVHGPTPAGEEAYKPGPCITGMIDLRDPSRPLSEGVVLEEGAMPGALAGAYALGFPALEALLGDPFRFGDADLRLADAAALGARLQDNPLELIASAYDGPVSRTLPFLGMSHDTSAGRLDLHGGRVRLNWPKAGRERGILQDEKAVRRACDAIGAEYLPNPIWQDAMGARLLTVHPLGGCAMADDAEGGVINHKCQVFDPVGGGVHEGLYVCDGAAIPRAIGVNPHLTITALAEYAVEHLALDRGWRIDWSDATPLAPPDRAETPSPEIAEILAKVIAGLETVETAIDARMYELARMMLQGLWRQFGDYYDAFISEVEGDEPEHPLPDLETFIRHMGDDETLEDVVSWILGDILDVLKAFAEKLEAGDLAGVLDVAEDRMGDFSPPVTFPETMSGCLRMVEAGAPDTGFDPYQVAGQGAENSRLTATIRAPAVRSAITPPDGALEIVDGRFWSEILGDFAFSGTFRFLMPDPDEIERWEMTYVGRLEGIETNRVLHFSGHKSLQRRDGSHWWRDLTELSVDISDGTRVIAQGMLRVSFEGAIAQANAIEVAYGDLRQDFVTAYDRISAVLPDDKRRLPGVLRSKEFRSELVKALVFAVDLFLEDMEPKRKLAGLYKMKVMARMGGLVLRNYGGILSYLRNFPALEAGDGIPPDPHLPKPEIHYPEAAPGVFLKLTRYRKPKTDKGPVILANGFGTRASSFATSTVERNVVRTLVDGGYDVWLFDYRGSGDIEASLGDFTLDDVATQDWPAAIDLVTAHSGAQTVQVLVHCVGSMTLFMAVLAGETRVRSIISSQLGPHAIINWFKYAQADSGMAEALADGVSDSMAGMLEMFGFKGPILDLAKSGLDVVEPRSFTGLGAPEETDLDPVLDTLVWKVPGFAPAPCYSPTCHRINFIFGPSYRHENLNQATHDAIRHMFGPVSPTPFKHISKIFTEGRVVSADGAIDYFQCPERLSMPVHFIAGARNQEMLPEATLRTLHWLKRTNKDRAADYTRKVYQDYGHMDCFIGKSAGAIFDDLLRVLDDHNDRTAAGES